MNSTALAKKYNFSHSTTNFQEILKDSDVDLVLITTRHNQHASQTVEALKHGKHVFVEKPLALNLEELSAIIETYNNCLNLYNKALSDIEVSKKYNMTKSSFGY